MNKDALFDVGSNYDNNRYTNIIPKIQYVPKQDINHLKYLWII